jgi:hypothetical protein
VAVLAAVAHAARLLPGLVTLGHLPSAALLTVAGAALCRVGMAGLSPETPLLSGVLLLLAVAVTAGAAAAFGALAIEVRRLLPPGGPRLLRLVTVLPLIVLLRQALLAARLLEAAILALLLLAAALAVFLVGHCSLSVRLERRP